VGIPRAITWTRENIMSTTTARPMEYTAEVLERLMCGASRMTLLGRGVPYRLTRAGRDRFEEAIRRGYCMAAGDHDPVVNCFRFWCQVGKMPLIVLGCLRRRVYVSLEWDGVQWRPDLDADLRLRAMLGMGLDRHFDGITVAVVNWYQGQVERDQADATGADLAAIIRDAEPWGVPAEGLWDHRGVECRRPVDWDTLIPLWGSRVRDDQARRAIRLGYFLARNVRETYGGFAYRDYCDIAGRPWISCRVKRGRADISVHASRRKPLVISREIISRLKTMIGETGRWKDGYVRAEPGGSDLVICRLRAAMAERVAFQLFEMLAC
jgi:hypothetical protein